MRALLLLLLAALVASAWAQIHRRESGETLAEHLAKHAFDQHHQIEEQVDESLLFEPDPKQIRRNIELVQSMNNAVASRLASERRLHDIHNSGPEDRTSQVSVCEVSCPLGACNTTCTTATSAPAASSCYCDEAGRAQCRCGGGAVARE